MSDRHIFAPDEQGECNECGQGRDEHPKAADGFMRWNGKTRAETFFGAGAAPPRG